MFWKRRSDLGSVVFNKTKRTFRGREPYGKEGGMEGINLF